MNLEGLAAGTRLVTSSGDIVELLEVTPDGSAARVRYVEVLDGGSASVNSEASLQAEDIATVDGDRFMGPPRTSSSSAS